MTERNNTDIATAAIVLFVIVGVLGIDLSNNQTVSFHDECVDFTDNDGDGNSDSSFDFECMDYPYEDGNGENTTSNPYPGVQSDYNVYNDFFSYANLSYPDALNNSYPGLLIDWTCDLVSFGSANYIKLYDIRYGTTVDDDLSEWVNINCIQAGNGILGSKPNNPPPEGEESQEIK